MKTRPGTKARQVKLTDEEWDALEAIAAREGLTWGGVPSRSDAIRWLITRNRDRACENFHKPDTLPKDDGPTS